MTRRAACSCGQLRLEIEGEPSRVSMCHCLECQRRTGAVISNQARFHREQITFAGQATAWSRKAESGNALTFYFCPTCGSTVYWEGKGFPGYVAVAIGNFADPKFPAPTNCGVGGVTPPLGSIATRHSSESRCKAGLKSAPRFLVRVIWRRFGPIRTQHAMLANVGVGSNATEPSR
jgi:hypothetical protein